MSCTRIAGVKLCRWTKSMLRGRGGCYKHTFYGIASYQVVFLCYTFVHVYIYIYTYIYMCIYIWVLYIYIYSTEGVLSTPTPASSIIRFHVYICMYIHMFIFIYMYIAEGVITTPSTAFPVIRSLFWVKYLSGLLLCSIFICAYIYIFIYAFIYIYIHVYIYI